MARWAMVLRSTAVMLKLNPSASFAHVLVGVGDGHGRADHSNLDVLDVLRPNGREAPDARADRRAGRGDGSLQDGPSADACLL